MESPNPTVNPSTPTEMESDNDTNLIINDPSLHIEIQNPVEEGHPVGFFDKSFKVLKKTYKDKNETLICSLLIGELKLNEKYEIYKGKTWGYTEGMGKRELNEPKKMASKAVVFVIISLTDTWKIPIALFFVHNPDIKCFADTIEEALTRLNGNGVKIISVTMNCVSPHLSFALAEELGAEMDYVKSATKNMSPYFPHPVDQSRVYILYDFDVLLGCIKRYWTNAGMILYNNDTFLKYLFTVAVRNVQENELTRYGNNTFDDWYIIRKRLCCDKYISKVTADAITYLKDLGHPNYQDSQPTITFIRILDRISAIAEVKNSLGKGVDAPLTKENESSWKPLIHKFINYLKQLKSLEPDLPKHPSVFKNIYVTGLVVSLTSLIEIYENHVKKEDCKLKCLLPDRFGLKHTAKFEDWPRYTPTAFHLYKRMRRWSNRLHGFE